MSNEKDDIESGSSLLYPLILESPELRWAFIRKVYSILTIQFLFTIGVAAIVTSVHGISNFFRNTKAGLSVYIVILVLTIIVPCLLLCFKDRHPWNYVLLGIYTLGFSICIGVLCSYVSGKVVIETVTATAAVFVSLTAYTFWAAKRGQDFSFLGPFLLSLVIVVLVFPIFQIFYPMGKVTDVIYSGLGVIIFSAYILYDTAVLIQQYSYDDYIWASVSLYVDVLNIYARVLEIIKAVNSDY